MLLGRGAGEGVVLIYDFAKALGGRVCVFVRVLSASVCVFVCTGGLRKEHSLVTAPPPVLHTLSAARPTRIYLTRQVRVAAAPLYVRE